MDYSIQTISGSPNIFNDSHYLNLKLASPPPSSLLLDPNDKENNDNNKSTPTTSSPVKRKNDAVSHLTLADELQSQNVPTNIQSTTTTKAVAKFDIYKDVLGKLGGKDRIAKVLQYVLNLLKYYLENTRRYLIDEKFTNLSLDPRLHYKQPLQYIKLVIFLNSTMLEKKFSEITKNISIFRQTLRFGGTPYRLRNFISKINTFLFNKHSLSLKNFQNTFLTKDALHEFVSLYYGICDELVLLYKLQVFSNINLKQFLSQQEAYAWYCDILLGLDANYTKLQENRNKQLQLNIQHQVKHRASQISKKLIESMSGTSPIKSQILREFNSKSPAVMSNGMALELEKLKHEERIIMTDLIRLTFDFCCDSIEVFKLKLDPVVYLICGAISGSFGLTKVWLMSKRELELKNNDDGK